MNLCSAFVGCVIYTFPFPSLKFVCAPVLIYASIEHRKTHLFGYVCKGSRMVQVKTVDVDLAQVGEEEAIHTV